jgi:chemotaxis protein CheZ
MNARAATKKAVKATPPDPDVHHKIGQLTRQLHDTLHELGLADKLRGTAEELPDVKSRLSYIARLTGEAAEKVLNRVDLAKSQNDQISSETLRIKALLRKDPVAAVAKGHVMNYLADAEASHKGLDQHLTEIMMAQDFHDLTGQVIARVVNLATTIEEQLVELLIQTAPPKAVAKTKAADHKLVLSGPVVDPTKESDVVTDQSQVDDLLASLGF